jgi:hypothetical protein
MVTAPDPVDVLSAPGHAPSAPEAGRIVSGQESSRLRYCLAVGEAPGDLVGAVGVASETDRRASLLVPPADDLCLEGEPGADLEHAFRSGESTKGRPELLLQGRGIEGRGMLRPRPQG